MNLSDLQNRHEGDTAWVFGSGATINHLSPSFFREKLLITTNTSSFDFGVQAQYAFTHHHPVFHSLAERWPETVFVANNFDFPTTNEWENPPDNVVIHTPKTQENSHAKFNPYEQDKPAHENQLVFGSTSAHGAMHLAAYLGAKNIVLVGVDCGLIDGETNFDDYPLRPSYPFHVYNRHLILMRDWLRDTYDVNTYSLNPFVNLHLEGHRFA